MGYRIDRATLLAASILYGTVALAQPQPRREMSTDRPDKTESPYTVDRGLFQIEADLFARTRDRSPFSTVRTTNIGTFNLKRGLSDRSDIQLILAAYVRERTIDPATGLVSMRSGVGDMTTRFKRNLGGNDGNGPALAIMPFVTLPTASNGLGADGVEGGVIVPLALPLSDRAGLGLMTQVDVRRDEDGSGYRAAFINSATVSVDLTSRLGAYGELFAEKPGRGGWLVTADAGLTYAVTGDLQLDAGANIGLTDPADDLVIFVGISHRF